MNNLQKQLDQDFELAYNNTMRSMYQKYRGNMSNGALRQCFLYWIFKHCHTKTMALISGQTRRTKRTKNIKSKIVELENRLVEQDILDAAAEVIK